MNFKIRKLTKFLGCTVYNCVWYFTESNHHGTRCAGEISAIPNDVCGVGVAYGAQISGIYYYRGKLIYNV